MDRVIALVDMDCFYVQVEQRENPQLQGQPCVVVQYKPYKGGGVLSVNYEARALGVSRYMFGDEVRAKFPDVQIARVPDAQGKAVLTKYREAGAEVIDVFVSYRVGCVERASVDEAYIDLTDEVGRRMSAGFNVVPSQLPNTIVAGFDCAHDSGADDKQNDNSSVVSWLQHLTESDEDSSVALDRKLAIGAVIVEELRAAVLERTRFRCSAGIAHNKMLAKLGCGMNKPNKQTIVPQNSVPVVFRTTCINKVRNLGGKLGATLMEELGVRFMADLCQFTEAELQAKIGERSMCVYNMCRGIDNEPVTSRLVPQSVGCSKNFLGKEQLDTKTAVRHWLHRLAVEVSERLIKDRECNNRIAKTLTVNITYDGFPSMVSASRSCAIVRYSADKIVDDAFALLQQFNLAPASQPTWSPPVLGLGLQAGKFIDMNSNTSSLRKFLSPCQNSDEFKSVSESSESIDSSISTKSGNQTSAAECDIVPSPSPRKKTSIADYLISGSSSAVVSRTAENSGSLFKDPNEHLDDISGCDTHGCKDVTADSSLQYSDTDDAGNLSVDSSSNLTDVGSELTDYVTCDQCNCHVSPWTLPEHLDWHLAIKVQDEETSVTKRSPRVSAQTSSSKKRKRSVAQGQERNNCSAKQFSKPLDSFFLKGAR